MNDDEKSNEQNHPQKNPLNLRNDGQRASYRIAMGDDHDAATTDDEAKSTRFLDSASVRSDTLTVPYSVSEVETVDEAHHGDNGRVLPAPPLRTGNLSNLSLRS